MKKLLKYMLPAVLALLAVAACEDHRSDYLEDFQTMVYFRNGGEQSLTLYRTGEEGVYSIPVCKSGRNLQGEATAEIIPFDEAAMALYNVQKEADYRLIPASLFKFVDEGGSPLSDQSKVKLNFGPDDAYKVVSIRMNTVEISQLKAEQQLKRYRLYLGLALLALVLLVVIVLVLRSRKNKELEALKSREAQLRLQGALEKATLHSWQVLQQQALDIYQSEQKDKLKQILEAFDKAYPQAKKKLQTVCPDLSETERNLAILTLLRFRSKEEANLLNLSENTVRKYRSTLNKKLDFNLFSDLVG